MKPIKLKKINLAGNINIGGMQAQAFISSMGWDINMLPNGTVLLAHNLYGKHAVGINHWVSGEIDEEAVQKDKVPTAYYGPAVLEAMQEELKNIPEPKHSERPERISVEEVLTKRKRGRPRKNEIMVNPEPIPPPIDIKRHQMTLEPGDEPGTIYHLDEKGNKVRTFPPQNKNIYRARAVDRQKD